MHAREFAFGGGSDRVRPPPHQRTAARARDCPPNAHTFAFRQHPPHVPRPLSCSRRH